MKNRFETIRAGVVMVAVLFAAMSFGPGVLQAHDWPDESWEPRPGCAHVMGDREWVSHVVGRIDEIELEDFAAANPWLEDLDRIGAGALVDVCPAERQVGAASSVSLSDRIEANSGFAAAILPEADRAEPATESLPGLAYEWAAAVAATAPDDATDAEIRKLVAVGGPESGWDNTAFNSSHTDRGWSNGVLYRGSAGVVQIRIMDTPPPFTSGCVDCVRNLEWLNGPGLEQEAQAAWTIQRAQGWDAWGPLRNRGTQLKLHEDCNLVSSSRRDACREYWRVADVALAAVAS